MKQTPRVLALLLCLAMLCTILPGAAMAESESVGTAEPLTAEGGSYVYAENRWDPDGETYVGTAEREFREYSSDFFLFKSGAVPVTDGLTSSNENVATVQHMGDGVWSVGMVAPGTTTLSVVVEEVTYAMVMTFVADSAPGEDPGDDSGSSDIYDVGNDTELLYIHDAWFDAWFTQLPAGDDWHGYFTFHAEEGGESLDPDGRVEFECTEGTTTVTATYVGDDPGEEGLVWVDNMYHIEVSGVGRGILKVIVGDVTYTAEVVVEGDPGSGEPDPGPGEEEAAQSIEINGDTYRVTIGGYWINEDDQVVCTGNSFSGGVYSDDCVTNFDFYVALINQDNWEEATEEVYRVFWENYRAEVTCEGNPNVVLSEIKTADDNYHKYVSVTVTGTASAPVCITANRVTENAGYPQTIEGWSSINIVMATELTLDEDGIASFEVENPERWADYYFFVDLSESKSATIGGSMTMEGAYGYLQVQGGSMFWSKYDDGHFQNWDANVNGRYIIFCACMYSESSTLSGEIVVSDTSSTDPDPDPGPGGGEQSAQLIGKIGQFVGEEGEWVPGTTATTSKIVEFTTEETLTIEFFSNGTKITNGIGLTSSNTDVASVSWHPVGAWDVRIQGTGVAELSATVDGVTYTYVIIVTDPSSTFSMTAVEYGAGPEGPMPMGRTYEGTYSGNVGNRIMLQFRIGDTPVVNLINSHPDVVSINGTGTDPVFNVELLSPGTATIAATDGKNTYTFTITVDGGSVTPVLTGVIGQFVDYNGGTRWESGTEATTSKTMEFTAVETITFEFFAGETEVTEEIGLTSSNTDVATVSWHPVGAWDVIIRGAGVAELSATLNGVTYTYIITVTDPGPGSEEPIEPTGNLFLYDVTFGQWFSGTLRAADHWIGTFSFHGLPFDPALMADDCQFIRTGGSIAVRITQTAGQNGPVYELYVTGTGTGVLSAIVGEEVYSITVTTEQGDIIEPLPTITVDHVEYSIGMGDANAGDSITFLGQGVNTTCQPGWTFVIAAMSGRGTDDMAEAPAKVYDYITNVTVDVIECTNLDAGGDQSQPNCSFVCGTMEYRGIQIPCVTLQANEGDYFAAKIRINVTVIDPESGEPEVFVLTSPLRYVDSVWLQLDASDLDTTEKLNAVLASDQAFVAWMKQKHPASYNQFINAKIHDMNAYVNVHLPGVAYDGIVVWKLTDNIDANLYGSMYEDQTVMAGLLIEGCFTTINYIAFVANDNLTQTYDGETFTCGIMTAGEHQAWDFSCVYWIMNCSFTGYDYGVRSTNDGLCMGIQRCMFIECNAGYYLDSYDRDGGPWTGEISDSLFVRNTTAVQIVTLPSYLSPYNFRIKNCDFIGNSMDFEVDDNGTFYFHSNYFGRIHQKAESESTSDLIQMLIAANTETKLNQVISTHPAQTNKIKGTKVITNPRWKYLYKGWTQYGMAPFALEEEAPYVNVLISDWTQETQIVDKEADGLVIDGSAFDMVTEEKKVIDVVDEHENALGTWIFD